MAALGMGPGRHMLGEYEVIVDDVSARLPDGVLAGSILSLDAAIRNLIHFTGCSLSDALTTVTTTPATLLGLHSRARPHRARLSGRPHPADARSPRRRNHHPGPTGLPHPVRRASMSPDPLKSTHVYREIHEQPEVMRRLLAGERTTMVALTDAMRHARD